MLTKVKRYGFLCLFLAGLFYSSVAGAADVKISFVDELTPLYPDSKIKTQLTEVSLDAAKGSVVGIHLFLKNLPDKEIVSLTLDSENKLPPFQVFKLIDVPVEINTGIESRTEKWDGKENPYVIRRAPFHIYEALQPIRFPHFTEQNSVAFRLQWKIPAFFEPGIYAMKITVCGNSFTKECHLILHIYDVTVPAAGRDSFGYTNWFSVKNIADWHRVELWTEPFWRLLKKYADMMYYGRQNMFLVRLPDFFEMEDDKPVLLQSRLERMISVFRNAGLFTIEFSHLASRSNGQWNAKTFNSVFREELPVNSTEGKQLYDQVFSQLREVIVKNGWQNSCCFHIADEPTDLQVKDYKKFVRFFRKYYPHLPIMEATMTQKLQGTVNIWVPQLQEYQLHRQFFDKRKKKGDAVWVYSCLIPGGPWLNRLLDQERLRSVFLGWSLPYYGLGGFLHWGLNHYHTKNPFVQSVVDHPQAPNSNNQLPAGDTHILYPGTDGPWSSIRFEAQRIGFEDAELFNLFMKRDKKKALSLLQQGFRAYDDYEKSVSKYRTIKKELLSELEK